MFNRSTEWRTNSRIIRSNLENTGIIASKIVCAQFFHLLRLAELKTYRDNTKKDMITFLFLFLFAWLDSVPSHYAIESSINEWVDKDVWFNRIYGCISSSSSAAAAASAFHTLISVAMLPYNQSFIVSFVCLLLLFCCCCCCFPFLRVRCGKRKEKRLKKKETISQLGKKVEES